MSCHNCRALEAAVRRGEETRATCSDCGAQWVRAPGPKATPPRAQRDLAALAARSPIRAIYLDPASKLLGGDSDLDAEVRADRSAQYARIARARLAELCARGPEGERFARALLVAYGARGPVVNERESLAVVVAAACLRFEPGDWGVVVAERRRITERATARKVQVPDAARLVATILGNAILGAAVAAYERDAWEDWRPRERPEEAPEEPARMQRARVMRAKFDARPSNSTRS
ncbi:MAG: hypothetical protein EKK55_10130 [Rhodocyclaceae bacterium]|nr:MAG: hypothetical protein EKK55_10130 [Rhodocyclaceae bacterium]